MKQYPAIEGPHRKHLDKECIAFHKYDGSNLRFEWVKKKGWHQQGTRHHTFDQKHPEYGPAIDLFQKELAPRLDEIRRRCWPTAEEFVAFCEWFGPYSFAGQHSVEQLNNIGFKDVVENAPMRLVLLDFNVHKQGLVDPECFCDLFVATLPKEFVAQPIWRGPMNQLFINSIFSMEFEDWGPSRENGILLHEGVVCKGGSGHDLWMAKIKTKLYHGLLRLHLPKSWQEHWDWEVN